MFKIEILKFTILVVSYKQYAPPCHTFKIMHAAHFNGVIMPMQHNCKESPGAHYMLLSTPTKSKHIQENLDYIRIET